MPDAPRATAPGIRASSAWIATGGVRVHAALLITVCLLLFLTGAASLPLTDPEEARCALIVREMIRSGDWLMPHLLGEPYFDKPAPFFWLAAAGEMLTGSAELGGRMVAGLAGVLAVLTTYVLGRRTFGATAGLVGGLALATSVEFWYMARWYRMDMPFAAAMWAAVAWFWLCERPANAAVPVKRWVAWCGFYLLCALAVLFKGPAGVALPVLIVGCHFLLSRQRRRMVEFFHPGGLALFALVVVPWYAAVSMRVPSYAYEFLFEQNVVRFAGTRFGHTWPGILFVPILLLGLLPWTMYLPQALRRHAPRRWQSRADHPGTLLLWLAALVPLVFFSLSSTKLVGYILPCFPPLAVLVGGVVAEWIGDGRDDRAMRFAAYAVVAIVAVMWVGAAVLDIRFAGIGPWVGVAVAACCAVAASMLLCLARRRRGAFVAWGVAGFVVFLTFLAAHAGREGYERLSARTLAASVPAADRRSDTFLIWPKMSYSFAYYLDAPRSGQLHRIGQEGIDTVAASLEGTGGAYVLVSGERNLRRLQARAPGRVEVVGRNGDMWLVSNHVVSRQERAGGAARAAL